MTAARVPSADEVALAVGCIYDNLLTIDEYLADRPDDPACKADMAIARAFMLHGEYASADRPMARLETYFHGGADVDMDGGEARPNTDFQAERVVIAVRRQLERLVAGDAKPLTYYQQFRGDR